MKNTTKVHITRPKSKSIINNQEVDDFVSHDNLCGIYKWRPDCLQKFRSVYLFLLTMCIVCILQTALSAGYMSSQITTLERRFSLDSYMLGVIQSFFDVGFIASVVFVGFFGGQGRIPLWIGCGMLIMSIGAFSFSIPEFITTYRLDKANEFSNIPLCHNYNSTTSPETCNNGNKANWLVKLLFIIGQILIGCGSSPVLSLGPTYIDDHVIPTVAPPLIAMLYASSALGPVLGFGLGAVMLRYPMNKDITPGSRPGDVDWIGAWWGGYVSLGTVCSIIAVFLFMFPKRVRQVKTIKSIFTFVKNKENDTMETDTKNSKEEIKAKETQSLVNENKLNVSGRIVEKEGTSSEVSRQMSNSTVAKGYGKNFRDIPGAILSLLKNKVYIVVSLAICCEMFLVNGFAAFLPKYIETEYKVSNITASLIAGGAIVPAGALGIIIGGVTMHKFKMSRKRAILFSIIAVLLVLLCLVLFFVTGCQNPLFAGINTPLRYEDVNYTSISNKCNENLCTNKCNPNAFTPVCDSVSGVTYFSPCFAGCKNFTAAESKKFYYNCSCTANSLNIDNVLNFVKAGECPLKCNSLKTFVLFLIMALFLTGITQNPLLMVTMRSVQKHERAFALGFQFVILRVLAYIPSPIVYGTVIDAACVHWKQDCSGRGDCLVTDLKLLNKYIIGLSFAVKFGAAFFYIILYFILPNHAHIMNPESSSGFDTDIRENKLLAIQHSNEISLNNQNCTSNRQDLL